MKDREYSKTQLGSYLKQLRKETGLSTTELARLCEVKQSYISMLESGDRVPSVGLIYRLATALHVPAINMLTLCEDVPQQLISDLEEKKELQDGLVAERLKRFSFETQGLQNRMSAMEVVNILEEKVPERLQNVHDEYVKKYPELAGLSLKEAIIEGAKKEPALKEHIQKNISPPPTMPYLEPPQMLDVLRRAFGWTWPRMGIEFGKTGRTLQRWAGGQVDIPKKFIAKLEFLYYMVYRRMTEAAIPLSHVYPGNSSIALDIILSDLEKNKLDDSIKMRFLERMPGIDKKKYQGKPLRDVLFEYAKTVPSFYEVMEANRSMFHRPFEKRGPWGKMQAQGNLMAVDKKKRLAPNKTPSPASGKQPQMQKTNPGEGDRRQADQSGSGPQGEEGGGDGPGDDEGIDPALRERRKQRIISAEAELLFDKLRDKCLGDGLDIGLLKEDDMKLYKRKDNPYYHVHVILPGNDGKRKRYRLSTGRTSKDEAEKVMVHMYTRLEEAATPLEQRKTPPTVEEASLIYLDEHYKDKVETTRLRDMHCHKDIAAYFGKFRMDEVTTPMVHQWFLKEQTRKTCSGKVIAPRTVNIARGYLHALFEFGRKIKEWNEKNPVSNVAPLKLPAPRNTFLREEDEQKFLAAIPDGGVRMTMKFAILTGLRKGEVVALKWEDVHMDTEPPYFTSKREKNGLVTDFPIVWQDLREVFDYFGNKAKEKTGQVFRNEKGEPITKDELYHGVTDASGKALTYHLQMNDLRRTFCSRLFWLGCNLTQVDYLMGHKTPGVNAHYRVYDLHNAAEELKRLEEVRNRRKAATKMTHQGGEEKE